MITIRKAADRGHANHGWLDTHHTFSFANYYDEAHMGFRALRVINDDVVAPGQGFGTHPHRDMEIITWVLSGAVRHQDSMGNGSTIVPGDVQKMSAGTGVLHSEFNPSKTEPLHLLQIWVMPDVDGIAPSYEQKRFDGELKGALRLIASPTAANGSVKMNADAQVYVGQFSKGDSASLALKADRHAWVHVARGDVSVNGHALHAGDGLAMSDETALEIAAQGDAEVLVFDLA